MGCSATYRRLLGCPATGSRIGTCCTLGPSGGLIRYEYRSILRSMRVGERGQVTIPKDIRDQFGLGPNSDVEFHVEHGSIILTKAPKRLDLDKWKGHCSGSLGDLGYPSVDDFIEDIRGR